MYQTVSNSPGQPWTHRVAEAGRELWTYQPLLQQHHPEQGAQAHVQVASGELQGGDPHSLWAACASALSPAPGCILCAPCLHVLIGIDEISLSLLFTRLSSPRSWPLLTGEVFGTLCSQHLQRNAHGHSCQISLIWYVSPFF